jgi:hypothetical protein
MGYQPQPEAYIICNRNKAELCNKENAIVENLGAFEPHKLPSGDTGPKEGSSGDLTPLNF